MILKVSKNLCNESLFLTYLEVTKWSIICPGLIISPQWYRWGFGHAIYAALWNENHLISPVTRTLRSSFFLWSSHFTCSYLSISNNIPNKFGHFAFLSILISMMFYSHGDGYLFCHQRIYTLPYLIFFIGDRKTKTEFKYNIFYNEVSGTGNQ